MEKLPPKVLDWLKKYALTYPNVIGFRLEFEPKSGHPHKERKRDKGWVE